MSTVLLYPLERIKVELQYTNVGLLNLLRHLLRNPAELYRGMLPLLAGNVVSYNIYFYFYELFQQYLPAKKALSTLLASTLAGIISTLCTNPLWYMQTRLSLNKEGPEGRKKIWAEVRADPSAMFKGLGSSLVLVSNPVIQFLVYEALKADQSRPLANFLNGFLSKLVASLLTYPLQVVRTFQHMEHGSTHLLGMLFWAVRVKGLLSLYNGFLVKMTQSTINSGIMLSLY
jgi:adenine nucleotide transporter 17